LAVENFRVELEEVYKTLDLEPLGFEKLVRHYELLVRWNRKINLTRIVDPREAAWRHFAEGLFILKHANLAGKGVLDVGSGGGFPSLPIAAQEPKAQVTALEPVSKKARFIREVSRDWPNVTVDERRLEDVTDQYDWAVVRAVRLEDRLVDLARVAGSVALLVAAETVLASGQFEWMPIIPLPWSPDRGLLLGARCSTWNI